MFLDPRPILKRTTATTAQQTTWLKDTAPLDPAWMKRAQHSYKLLVDTLSADPEQPVCHVCQTQV